MHRSKLSTSALLAVGLTGLLAADASVVRAQAGQETVIQVDVDRQDLDQTTRTRLDAMAEWLKEDPNRVINIESHPGQAADTRMQQQTMTVAERARAYLKAAGVRDQQINIIRVGQERPAATPEQRSLIILLVPTEVEPEMGGEADADVGAGIGAEAEIGDAEIGAGAQVQGDLDVEDEEFEEPAPVYTEPEPTAPPPATAPYAEPPEREDAQGPLLTPFGMAVSLGGGVVGFVDGDTTDFTDPGGSWEARLTLGTRTPVGFEAAYVGYANPIDALGLDEDAWLLGTIFEGVARVNVLSDMAVQPYLFGGLGYTRFDIQNTEFNTSNVQGDENMGHVPVGAGIGFRTGGLLVDVRGTFRAAFGDDIMGEQIDQDVEDIVPDTDDPRAELDNWNVAARLGFEF